MVTPLTYTNELSLWENKYFMRIANLIIQKYKIELQQLISL